MITLYSDIVMSSSVFFVMVELYRRKTHISTKKFVFFCVKKEYDLCNFVSVLQKKLKLRTFLIVSTVLKSKMHKKTTLRCKKSRVYMGFLCRFNKKQCENQKGRAKREGRDSRKSGFEINIKIARIVPNGAVNELCRIWSNKKIHRL